MATRSCWQLLVITTERFESGTERLHLWSCYRLAASAGDRRGWRQGGPLRVLQAAVYCYQDLSGAGPITVLTEPHTLPRAEVELAIRERHSQVGTKEARLDVGRHIIWALAGVAKRKILRHDPVQHHLHVVPDVGVPVLVDGKAGRGVEELDVQKANAEL